MDFSMRCNCGVWALAGDGTTEPYSNPMRKVALNSPRRVFWKAEVRWAVTLPDAFEENLSLQRRRMGLH
jgi:hypothetical protein